jgi:hypothetical protein
MFTIHSKLRHIYNNEVPPPTQSDCITSRVTLSAYKLSNIQQGYSRTVLTTHVQSRNGLKTVLPLKSGGSWVLLSQQIEGTGILLCWTGKKDRCKQEAAHENAKDTGQLAQ